MVTPCLSLAPGPGTPARLPFAELETSGAEDDDVQVMAKEESVWPAAGVDGIIDLEPEENLWEEEASSEEEDEDDSSDDGRMMESPSSLDGDRPEEFSRHFEDEPFSIPSGPSLLEPRFFINVKTLVVHEASAKFKSKCGRQTNDTCPAVKDLRGSRCGKCFAIDR